MAKFAIPKKVTFEYLGTEFKDSYLIFRSVPTTDFDELDKLLDKSKDSPELPIPVLIKTLEKYFLEGSFYDFESKGAQEVTKNDLGSFDTDIVITCFKAITGTIDPKVSMPSTPPSTTEPNRQ